MAKIVIFRPEHFNRLEPQIIQQHDFNYFSKAVRDKGTMAIDDPHQGKWAFTIQRSETDPFIFGIVGLIKIDKNSSMLWGIINKNIKKIDVVSGISAIKELITHFFEDAHVLRITASVFEGFENGERLMKILGFTKEIPMDRCTLTNNRVVIYGREAGQYGRNAKSI